MKNGDQIAFQVKDTPEGGKSRVFVRSRDDSDSSALASVFAKDFRLGAHGESLAEAFAKLTDLDNRFEKTTFNISRETKAAHRRMDHTFPSLDVRLSVLEEKNAKMIERSNALSDNVHAMQEQIARLQADSTRLSNLIDALGTVNEELVSEVSDFKIRIDETQEDMSDLKRFNEKVVLFYDEEGPA
jgi:chromosome segregation ATPase